MNASVKDDPNPYAIGSAIGLLNILSFLTTNRGLGVTSAFEDAVALTEKKLAPRLTRINHYMKERDDVPKLGWETFLVAGISIGSALASQGDKPSSDQPKVWEERFGRSSSHRFLASFASAGLMMFGARLAKGCTSGHGITGTSQLALSSWVFTPIMFGAGVLTAKSLYRQGLANEK